MLGTFLSLLGQEIRIHDNLSGTKEAMKHRNGRKAYSPVADLIISREMGKPLAERCDLTFAMAEGNVRWYTVADRKFIQKLDTTPGFIIIDTTTGEKFRFMSPKAREEYATRTQLKKRAGFRFEKIPPVKEGKE